MKRPFEHRNYRVSRRRFLRGIGIALSPMLLHGCSPKSDDQFSAADQSDGLYEQISLLLAPLRFSKSDFRAFLKEHEKAGYTSNPRSDLAFEELCSIFLLSTDLFYEESNGRGEIEFVRYHNPHDVGCQNPFRKRPRRIHQQSS